MQASSSASDGVRLATLGNGVRVVVIPMPHAETVNVSVFVRTGSSHESRRDNGISHFVEHMAFKGTHDRSCQQINLDAERLGADVNAHTDKDHTAFHMRGLARDAGHFIRMLGDIVLHSTFPEDELERERQVLLHEYAEDEEDPLSSAYRLFDKLCFGDHALAQPVMGLRGNIQRFTRDDLIGYVKRQYAGGNVVIGVAGNVDVDAIVNEAEATFGTMPSDAPADVSAPIYVGGTASRSLAGSGQTHVVLGFEAPSLHSDRHHASLVAATLFGEGMSSPLLDQIRERRGLAYYLSCSADINALAGQFVIEASTAPEHVDEFFVEVQRLIAEQADRIAPIDLERARNQMAVRRLHARERGSRRIEDAALDLWAFGRVRGEAEMAALTEGVTAEDVRAAFASMQASRASVAVTGRLRKGLPERLRERFGAA